MSSKHTLLSTLFTTLFLLGLWQILVSITHVEPFILPSPLLVFSALIHNASFLLPHALFTLSEILIGLILGFFIGFFFGLLLSYFSPVRRLLLPILVLSQALPVFALAPLLVLWLGYGIESKIAMAALIIFFPVASATHDGLRAFPPQLHTLCLTTNAHPLRSLFFVRIPASLPTIASGIRIATATAPIGAIVGEWVGSAQGLGFVMLHANARIHTDLMFAALFILVVLSLSLYALVNASLQHLMFWQEKNSL